jgi:hypothetical protein
MRFSLRTLMLMFPAFLIAWFLAAMYYQVTRGMIHPKWIREVTKLNSMHSAGIGLWVQTGRPLDVEKINAWLAGKIAYSDPDFRELAGVLAPYGMNDLHDQPYRCVALDQTKMPSPEANTGKHVGFYSVGKDGKSATYGHDPDDFNSWEELVHPYHLEQSNIQHLINVLAIIPFTLPFVLIFGWWVIGRREATKPVKGQ